MTIEEARGIAAKAWCHSNNRRRILDPGLCEAFAEIILDEVSKITPTLTTKDARDHFKKVFKDDPSFRNAYVANIAETILSDQVSDEPGNLMTRPDCGAMADQIIKRIFES